MITQYSCGWLTEKILEGKDNLSSYKVSVFLSALTTIVAMGLDFCSASSIKIMYINYWYCLCYIHLLYDDSIAFKMDDQQPGKSGKTPLTAVVLVRFVLVSIWLLFIVAFLMGCRLFLYLCGFLEKDFAHAVYKYIVYWISAFFH